MGEVPWFNCCQPELRDTNCLGVLLTSLHELSADGLSLTLRRYCDRVDLRQFLRVPLQASASDYLASLVASYKEIAEGAGNGSR